MRIYWYWPHPHLGTSRLATATIQPGDELVVESLGFHRGRPLDAAADYEIVRDLADPSPLGLPKPIRAGYPLFASTQRAFARRRTLARGFDVAYLHQLHYLVDWRDLSVIATRVPLVSMVHDVRPHARHFPARMQDSMLRAMYRNAGELVVYHSALREELIAAFSVDHERIHVVPIPFDASDQRLPDVPRADRPLFLLFGVLRPNKGLDTLIEAVRLLGPDFTGRVVVAGAATDDYARRLTDRARGVPALHFEFGRVSSERKSELFSSCWRVLLPYHDFHSQSAVLADAYAHRVPVIASDVGALGATVREDGTGVVLAPRDVTGLAAALMDACSAGPSDGGATASASEKHDQTRVGPLLRAIYDVAAARRG
jgi:glycosyltransferase involved in cell wall biosynthesis